MKFTTLLRTPGGKPWMIFTPAASLLVSLLDSFRDLLSNVNQLEKLLKTSCGDKGCCDKAVKFRDVKLTTLRNKFKQQSEENNHLNKIVTTAEFQNVSSQLKQTEQQIQQKIDDLTRQIENLKQQDKNLKKASEKPQNASQIDKLNKDLQSHNASKRSLETLKELCDFANKVNNAPQKNNGECLSILTNLTDGLEKFLGFNPDSKGYDGTGIVYSDLDRLCDGVMAFLHGVLQTVKNDESVKKYDNMLQEPTKKLNDVLDTLTKNIGSGRVGLSVSVTKVKEWLEGYNDEVGKKTKAVTQGLSALIGKLRSDISSGVSGMYYTQVSRMEGDKLQDQLKAWQETLPSIFNDINNIEYKHINSLDSALRDRITNEIKPIHEAVKLLRDSANNLDLKNQARNVDEQLKQQKSFVETAIKTGCDELQTTLDAEFKKIWKEISSLIDTKKTQIQHIKEALSTAKGDVNILLSDFNGTYKKDVSDMFEDLNNQMEKINPNAVSTGPGSELKKQFNNITTKVTDVDKKLKDAKNHLVTWIQKAGSVLDRAIRKAQNEVYKKMDPGGTDSDSIGDNITKLSTAGGKVENANQELSKIDGSLNYWITQTSNLVDGALNNANNIISQMSQTNTENITQSVADLKQKSEDHFLQYKQSELMVYAHQANENLNKLANAVERLVDERLKPALEKYKEWVKASAAAQPSITHDSRPLIHSIVHLKNISNVLQQAAQQQLGVNGGRRPYGFSQSPLQTSLYELQKQSSEIHALENEVRRPNQSSGLQTKNPDQVAKDLQTLSTLTVNIRRVMNDSITALNESINAGLQSASLSVTMSLTSQSWIRDSSTFSNALRNAHTFCQHIQKLESQFRSQPGGFDINITTSRLDNIMQVVASFGTQFANDRAVFEKFNNGITEPFRKLVQAVTSAAGEEKNGLQQILGKQLKEMYFNRPASDLEENQNSIHQFYKVFGTQKSELSTQPGAIKDATSAITTELRKLIEKLKEDVVGKLQDLKTNGINDDTVWNGTVGLCRIHNDIIGILGTNVSGNLHDIINKASPQVNAIILKLEELPDKVEQVRQVTQGKLEALERAITEIHKKIEAVEFTISQADFKLGTVIKDLGDAAVKVEDTIKTAISNLKKSLLTVTKQAFSTLTTDVQNLFADGHKANLLALKYLVERQSAKIANIIFTDTTNGLKGFLNTFSSYLELNMREFQYPEFTELSSAFNNYLSPLLSYTAEQVKTPSKAKKGEKQKNEQLDQVSLLQSNLDLLLSSLKETNRFDFGFRNKLDTVMDVLSFFSPRKFSGSHNPELLDALKGGVKSFCDELDKVYMNVYEAHPDQINWSQLVTKNPAGKPGETKDELSQQGKNLSKICLTTIETLLHEISDLRNNCYPHDNKGAWKDKHIYRYENGNKKVKNPLGDWFKRAGYIVSDFDKQEGELRNKPECKGEHVYKLLVNDESTKYLFRHVDPAQDPRALRKLHNYVETYYYVGHLAHIPSPKAPTTVHHMLCWCLGLYYNPVYNSLKKHIATVVKTKDAKSGETLPYTEAYPTELNAADLVAALNHIISQCASVLTTILGTGDAETTYASDFYNNTLNLRYPNSGQACLDMFLDILRRLFLQLKFLETQCALPSMHHGWRGCLYGRDIKTTKSLCDNHIGNKQSDCLPRSPLMSYLNDCLPGHLPHQLSEIGCKTVCTTCPSGRPGMPCLTPLGFKGFSGSTRRGNDLYKVLTKFFYNVHITGLMCLIPKPPSTLPEHIGFALSLVASWFDTSKVTKNEIRNPTLQSSFESSISSLSIQLYPKSSELTNALMRAYGSQSVVHQTCQHHHLLNLISGDMCINQSKGVTCSPYISSLCIDSYHDLAYKHCNTYLSWAIYLPWTFWDLLNNLYNAFCGITCADWGCRGCLRGDKCKSGKHGIVEDEKKDVTCQCSSIVSCRGVAPTLYQYGFSFGEASTLNGGSTVKKCKDFCSQLRNVLKSEYFRTLFKECDNFLCIIRWPFMLTLLSLWSLSLLYLLHITVVRLDVLRIRSHLRSPSSHRIAAQSLLAAARVKALANVKHGNGENGLENLAEALKKLIGDAIESATSSLSKRENELKCPDKRYDESLCKSLDDKIVEARTALNSDQSRTAQNLVKKSLTDLASDLEKHKSNKQKHYNEVHYLTDDARGKALEDIDAHRISLGQLAGQLSDFIGGGEEVKKAILNGLHSNVTQLEKLVKTSCGDKGCCKDAVNFRVGPLKNLQEQFNDIDKIEREIDGLNKQKDEKGKAPVRAPSDGQSEIDELTKEIQENEKQLEEQKKSLNVQIEKLQSPLNEPKMKIQNTIDSLTASVRQCEEEIEQYKKAQKASKNDPKNISIPYHLSNPLATAQAKLKSHKASLNSLESLDKLITFHNDVQTPKSGECKNILTNLCSGLEKFLGYQETSKGYDGTGIVYSDLDRLCDGVMSFLHGVLESVKDDESVKTYDNNPPNDINNVLDRLNDSVGKGREAFPAAVTQVSGWLKKHGEQVEKATGGVKNKLGELIGNLSSGAGENENVYYKNVKEQEEHKLQDQLKSWKSTLVSLKNEVDGITKTDVKALDNTLQSQITHKIDPITSVIEHLQNSASDEVMAACQAVDRQLDEHKARVLKHIEDDCTGLLETLYEEVDNMLQKISELQGIRCEQFGHIKNVIEHIKFAVGDFIENYDNNYSAKISTFFDIIRKEVESVYKNLKVRKDSLNRLIRLAETYYIRIKKKIGEQNKEGVIGDNWKKLKTRMTELVGEIKGNGSGDGLGGVAGGVKEYATDFSEGTFGTRVEGWIDGILNEDPVKGWMKEYASSNDDKFVSEYKGAKASDDKSKKLKSKMANAIRLQIEKKLGGDLSVTMCTIGSADDKGSISKNLAYVKDICEGFAKRLGERIRKETIDGFVNQIVMAIEEDPKIVDIHKKREHNQYNLKYLVLYTLHQLVATARKAGAEVYSFTADHKSKLSENVHGAIEKVTQIGKYFDKDDDKNNGLTTDDFGKKIDDALEALRRPIRELDTLFQEPADKEYIFKELATIEKHLSTLDQIKQEKEGGKIYDEKGKADKLMSDLKHNIQQITSGFDSIDGVVKNANDVLEKGLLSVTDALLSFRHTLTNDIQTLQKDLTETAKNAFEEITVQVRLLFSHSRTADLTALRKLVDAQKTAIEGIIKKDLANGVKGLLDKMLKTHTILEPMKDDKELTVGTPKFKKFYEGLWSYIIGQLTNHPSKDNASKVNTALTELLQKMIKENHFSHEVSDLIKKVADVAEKFSPAKFTDPSSPILQALKDGIGALAKQLGYAYVSTYCCQKFDGALLDPEISTASDDKRKLTEYGKKLSKVFMTCLPGWGKHLDWLRRHCDKDPKGPWNGLQITKLKNNPLGLWFDSRGYKVSDSEKPEGELNIIQDPKHGIHGLLVDNREIEKRLYRNDDEKKDPGTLREVCKYLPLYFQVRHHEHFDSPKPPTTVSHMLQWITGLTYNPMLEKLDSHFTTMFQGLKKAYKLDNPHIAITKPFTLSGALNDNTIRSSYLSAVLRKVCETAESVLIAFQGHGHAAGRYACEYSSNVDKLDYTTSPSKCFDLLCEICLKLHDQLNFLYRHCSHPSKLGGWQDCWYGNGVAGTSWQCNNLQCPDQPYNQEGNQKHNQQCDQNCNQNADCGLKSPLQSYLEDGLPGFIPHHLKKLGCGVECSLGKHRGLPCLIPMGFSEIGTVASHRQKGEDLKKVLEKFCGQPSKPLTLFCSYVKCLLHIPPQTLGDMFAFYYGFLNGWDGSGPNRKVAFEQAVQNADFENRNTTLNVGTMFQSSDHTGTSTTHVKGDLCSLVTCDGGIATLDPVGTCGPYLRPLCMDNRGIYSSTFKNYYLSWIVYATETFSRLLKDLLEECRQSCGLPKSKCHTTNCVTNCRTVVSDITSPNKNHQQGCKSIVKCKSTLPNLYKYGFYFGNTQKLNGTEDIRTKRTCNDFCDALDRVLSEVKDKNDVLAKLIYETIPKFLWDIRSKFYYLLLALWSLSLLYLLHIAVVRLDVLRIRSHLRSPSSHRIAAQSLLAAARVKALANVKYFSP
ncbi:hypothetical protein, conserved [Babesia ovata]|uniref:C3H1-type domain-containing protein n=1 Tax=Babesia ovata TaxID=189622 RepID=A0A2H6KIV2_9APIC|nr:uncharacterized protein BOVATA_044130 [Babesia ovata]GBE62920.1 hypothetical protein, conserved [Babesia ovata]